MKIIKLIAAVLFAAASTVHASADFVLTEKLFENFEIGCALSGVQVFEEDDGNKAMRLCDELTGVCLLYTSQSRSSNALKPIFSTTSKPSV